MDRKVTIFDTIEDYVYAGYGKMSAKRIKTKTDKKGCYFIFNQIKTYLSDCNIDEGFKVNNINETMVNLKCKGCDKGIYNSYGVCSGCEV